MNNNRYLDVIIEDIFLESDNYSHLSIEDLRKNIEWRDEGERLFVYRKYNVGEILEDSENLLTVGMRNAEMYSASTEKYLHNLSYILKINGKTFYVDLEISMNAPIPLNLRRSLSSDGLAFKFRGNEFDCWELELRIEITSFDIDLSKQ